MRGTGWSSAIAELLFSHWVEEVHIVVERTRGMERANNKTAVV